MSDLLRRWAYSAHFGLIDEVLGGRIAEDIISLFDTSPGCSVERFMCGARSLLARGTGGPSSPFEELSLAGGVVNGEVPAPLERSGWFREPGPDFSPKSAPLKPGFAALLTGGGMDLSLFDFAAGDCTS